MRKGPWTAEEDAMLIDYVNKYGEGNWNNVHKNSPLARCGKSCRLRWANHLRPNLKKAPFSLYEQSIIIHLHSKLGNKWARMASMLPGRTDNEIKNFWNTRMKRSLKAGFPVYPLPSQDTNPPYQYHYFTQPPSFSFPSPHSALHAHPYSNALLGLPLSPYASSSSSTSSSSSSSTLQNHGLAATDHSVDYGFINSSAVTLGSLYVPLPLVPGLSTEISSSQTPPASSSYSTLAINYYEEAAPLDQPNSGLLEDLVMEARAFARHEKSKNADSTGEDLVVEAAEESAVTVKNSKGDAAAAADTDERDVFRLFPLSTEKKPSGEDPLEENDDLFSLLNNFSSELPMPEWYSGGGGRQSLELESQADTLPDSTDQEFAWAVGDSWNNIPGIC